MWNHVWGWDGGWGMGWGWFGLMHLAWWLVLIAGAAFLVRALWGGRDRRDGALDILRERYARGEIDQAEYEQRSRLLRG